LSKRSRIDILKAFYKILTDKKPHTIDEIATKIGTNWNTIRQWANIIEFIQTQPKIEIIENKITQVRIKQ